MKNVIGRNLKTIRNKLGITQELLAIKLELSGWHINRFTISKIERGERQVTDIEVDLLANALKISIQQLFERE